MNEEKVYLLLTDTGTLFTKLIKLYTRRPYNHASIAFDKSLKDVYSFGRKSARNPFIGGFVKEDVKNELFKEAKCAVYCCTVADDHIEKMNQYIRCIESQKENYRYNLIGLFAIMLNLQFNRENAFFCSQFVANVLKQSDNIAFEKPLSLLTPHDLKDVPDFQLIYKGKLVDFYNPAESTYYNLAN